MQTTRRRPLLAGNWKMYKTRLEAQDFVQTFARLAKAMPTPTIDWALCVGFTLLDTVSTTAKTEQVTVMVAAQTMESREEGAYTGEVSAKMLLETGAKAVGLGQSERRQYFNETDDALNAKIKTALTHGLTPIYCVGETLQEREAGQTDAVVLQQLKTALAGFTPEQVAKQVIAYEPVWAIGTGKVCEASEANRVCGVLRQAVVAMAGEAVASQLRVLYGGSMNPGNAAELLAQSDIDGGLIGGASLSAESFYSIGQAVAASPVGV
jgi:triosephosphate isomerase (TIM)